MHPNSLEGLFAEFQRGVEQSAHDNVDARLVQQVQVINVESARQRFDLVMVTTDVFDHLDGSVAIVDGDNEDLGVLDPGCVQQSGREASP